MILLNRWRVGETMPKVLTLYYHRVTEYNRDINLIAVTPNNFREQMKWLKDNYLIVRAEDDWEELPRDAVCITLDDGYIDNLVFAAPILEELQIPATIFVSTQGMRNIEQVWWNELENMLLEEGDYPEEFHLNDEYFECTWKTDSPEKRKNCYVALHFLMKNYFEFNKRENVLEQLEQWSGRKTLRNYIVDVKQCESLSSFDNITIGAHTVTHPSLKTLSPKKQEYEIKESIKDIERVISHRVKLFSYPFGYPDVDYDEEAICILKNTGIMKAFTTGYALWKPGCSEFEIPRLVARDWDLKEFINYIGEAWHI